MMKLPLLIFTFGAALVEASVKARPSRNKNNIVADRSRKVRLKVEVTKLLWSVPYL